MSQPKGHTSAAADAAKYVSFMVGGEEYGADITRVQEIKVWDAVTRVPHTPSYLLGVLNLRGAIVPVIDLRLRFGLEHAAFHSTTVIVVVRVPAERGERTVGLVVDAVMEVHEIAADQIQPAPSLGAAVDLVLIKGIATLNDRIVILLDVETLVRSAAA